MLSRVPTQTLPVDTDIRLYPNVREFICPSSPEREAFGNKSIFAGGGITNCPDWQADFAKLVDQKLVKLHEDYRLTYELPAVSIFNPRRINFPIGDPNASPFQIEWEAKYLKQAKAISIWFPANSEGPISLFETGKWAMSAKPLLIGIEPGYPRSNELIAQIKSIRPDITIATTLEEHAEHAAKWSLGVAKLDLPKITQRVRPHSIYLTGGIGGCPDWQSEISTMLQDLEIRVVNPRKKDFIRGSDLEYREQVRINRIKLNACEAVVLWFPKEKLTPIALFELGSLVSSSKPIFIGIDPGYTRQIDVEIQTRLSRPEIDIVYSLQDLATQVKEYYSMRS